MPATHRLLQLQTAGPPPPPGNQATSILPPSLRSPPCPTQTPGVCVCACVRAGFPPGPPGDQAVNLLLSPLAFLRDTTARYGSVVGLLLGTERVVLVTSKEAARQVREREREREGEGMCVRVCV
jgi:hypothetical protein